MSTSLIYHGFGLRGYDYVRHDFVAGNILLTVRPKDELIRCPCCRSRDVVRHGVAERWVQTVPIGFKPVWLVIPVQRVECRNCGIVRRIDIEIAEPRRWHTKAFERYALALAKKMTMQDVADLLGVGWDTIKSIFKRYLHRRFSRPKLGKLKYIAIDEISVRKGQKYLTLVMDLESGAVVFVGDGRSGEALLPFWQRLKRTKAKIQAVATDMSTAYIAAVMEHLPKAALVFDRFHVVKLMNEKITEIRRNLFRELTSPLEKKAVKGTRWILLKNPENLDESRDEKQRLDEALRLNKPLATAYYLKEDLRQLWSQPDKATAETVINDWIARAEASEIRPLQVMARTLAMYRFGILAYYDHPISSGPMEGTNNKIKTLKRQAYGYRDTEFFKLRIMGIHEAKYALAG
jgi:transposase